jgi:hypothetical protein
MGMFQEAKDKLFIAAGTPGAVRATLTLEGPEEQHYQFEFSVDQRPMTRLSDLVDSVSDDAIGHAGR